MQRKVSEIDLGALRKVNMSSRPRLKYDSNPINAMRARVVRMLINELMMKLQFDNVLIVSLFSTFPWRFPPTSDLAASQQRNGKN